MYKTVFILLLFAHIIGDYYFQSQKFAEQKEKSIIKVLVHSLIYTLICFVVVIPVINKWLIIAATIVSISHLIIDVLKWTLVIRAGKDFNSEKKRFIYIIDQAAHLFFIFITAIFVAIKCDSLVTFPAINYIFEVVGIDKLQSLSYLLLALLIWKPTNITIKKVLSAYKPIVNEVTDDKVDKNVGGFIGLLERIVILLLLSISQYSAIGFILTAKSIARYNKIAENKQFAEYYLLGTLLSTAIALFSFFVII